MKITSAILTHEYSEYRHVTLPRQIAQYMPHNRLLTDDEWRSLAPEPHILLFKREKFYKQKYLTEQTTEPDNPTTTTTMSTNVDVAISPGNLPKPLMPEHQNLGDLIISIPYVINWYKRNNKYYTTCRSFKKIKQCLNIEKRLIELYVHGVLHLL
ncbi:6199_t:CDS:2, partial [Entrophospora sp. SA101]